MFRRFTAALGAGVLLASLVATSAFAGGPPQLGFYVDGTLYRTVGTPTDFIGTGAPARSFDHIYVLGNGLANVADAKPGDRDFNGGRWMVFPLNWADGVAPVQLTSDAQIWALAAAGKLSVATSPVKAFECPVIPANHAA
jgi:hypothetical protein